MRLLVVFNSFARSGRAANNVDALKAAFDAQSVDTEFALTRRRGDATTLVASADMGQFDAVVAVGGATLNA